MQLCWVNSADSDGDALTYTVEIGEDATYYVRVRANDGRADGDWSTQVSFHAPASGGTNNGQTKGNGGSCSASSSTPSPLSGLALLLLFAAALASIRRRRDPPSSRSAVVAIRRRRFGQRSRLATDRRRSYTSRTKHEE